MDVHTINMEELEASMPLESYDLDVITQSWWEEPHGCSAGCSERTGEEGEMGILCLSGKAWVASKGDYLRGFSQEMPEASPVSDEDSASWIQDGTIADQSWALSPSVTVVVPLR